MYWWPEVFQPSFQPTEAVSNQREAETRLHPYALRHPHCSATLQYVRTSVPYVAAWALWPMPGPV